MAKIFDINRPSNKITLGTTGTIINIASHTASLLLSLDASKDLESVSDLTAWVKGTANQITSTQVGGTAVLSIPNPFAVPGKLTAGSFGSPLDVTNTREYGVELHYSGNNYNATTIRARAHAVTSDTSAQFQGGLFQAANNNGIDVGVLNGIMSEAIGKSGSTSATIGTMRGGLSGAEWGAKDTVTNLFGHHIRIHSRNAAGEGSFGTGHGLYIENEAVGGNGQALDAGIYFKGTNLSAGNKAFTYGIDFSGATYVTADIKLSTANIFTDAWGGSKFNTFLGIEVCGAGNLSAAGIQNTGIGYKALENIITGDANTMVGYKAGGEITTGIDSTGCGRFALGFNTGSRNTGVGANTGVTGDGSGCVFLGFEAGYYETGSDKLFIDNASRTNEADARVKALMYGVFAAAVANQDLVFNADVGINTVPTLPLDVKAKAGITAIGGYVIKLTNNTGSNSVEGQLVEADDTDENSYKTADANAVDVIGVVYNAGVADGSEVWIVIAGIAEVLLDAGGCVHHDRLISSATAGSADVSNAPAVAVHFQEIGHALETVVGAGLAKVVIHLL